MQVELRGCRSHSSNQVEQSGDTIGTPYTPQDQAAARQGNELFSVPWSWAVPSCLSLECS